MKNILLEINYLKFLFPIYFVHKVNADRFIFFIKNCIGNCPVKFFGKVVGNKN